jgi:hypothetical protein
MKENNIASMDGKKGVIVCAACVREMREFALLRGHESVLGADECRVRPAGLKSRFSGVLAVLIS